MKIITSTQNSEIKAIVKLGNKKDRQKVQLFIAEGIRVISALVESGHALVALYCTEEMMVEAEKLTTEEKPSEPVRLKYFGEKNASENIEQQESLITLVSEPVMKKISQAATPSGLLGIFSFPEAPTAENLSTGLVLAQIANPGNMGTLIRTSAALGYTSIVIIEGCDPYSPKVVQSSAGTISSLTIFQWSWAELLQNKGNINLIALIVSGGKKPADSALKNALLVVGSESQGLPKEWIDQCDERMTLPMPGGTESLNAAVAGSIALYASFDSK